MSVSDAEQKIKAGDKAMKKSFFSSPKPDRAITHYEEAYKMLKRLGKTKELQTKQVECLQKQAVAQMYVDSYYKAGQCHEYAALILEKRDGEGSKTHTESLLSSADAYAEGNKAMKATQMYLKAAKLMTDDPDALVKTVAKLVEVCEFCQHSTFSETMGPGFTLLVDADRLDEAIDLLHRENKLILASNKSSHLLHRNLLSETVLLLSKSKRDKARQILSDAKNGEAFFTSHQYAFARKLLKIFDTLNQEELDGLRKGQETLWLLLGGHNTVARIGKKMEFGKNLKKVDVLTGQLESKIDDEEDDGPPKLA